MSIKDLLLVILKTTNFEKFLDPFYSSGNGIVSIIRFLLTCTNYALDRQTLLNIIRSIDLYILAQKEISFSITILFGKSEIYGND